MNEHLDVLQLRLSNERMRLAQAKTPDEWALRTVWIAQLEKEIAGEIEFLNKQSQPVVIPDDPDELLRQLSE